MDDFDIAALDEVIHGRVRLGIMAYLVGAESADFGELKARLSVTDGNLSVHLSKLEEAGYVAVDKGYNGKKPRTLVRLTPEGRAAFARYLDAIGRLAREAGAGAP